MKPARLLPLALLLAPVAFGACSSASTGSSDMADGGPDAAAHDATNESTTSDGGGYDGGADADAADDALDGSGLDGSGLDGSAPDESGPDGSTPDGSAAEGGESDDGEADADAGQPSEADAEGGSPTDGGASDAGSDAGETAAVVAFSSPPANQLYVAFGQSVSGAIANQQDLNTTLVADIAATVTAAANSQVRIKADGAVVATKTLPTAITAQTLVFSATNIPIPAGAAGIAHTLTLEVLDASSQLVAQASEDIQADVYPPAPVASSLSVTSSLAGVVHVSTPTLPGDDGSLGLTAPAWEIRYSLTTPLTAANWSIAGNVLVHNLAGSLPTAPTQSVDLFLPTDQSTIWIGLRAIDRVGNLGGITDQTATSAVATSLVRTAITVPNASTSPGSVVKVADIDGDGFDDIVIAYPFEAALAGRIYIWFGGLLGPSPPMVLSGTLANGLLGLENAFEVADVDGDGLPDVLAAASDCTTATLSIWAGNNIRQAKATNTLPASVSLSDPALLGGTLRAVGKATGGSGPGSDLLVSNFTTGCGGPPNQQAVILPRGGAWWTNGTTAALSVSGAVKINLMSATDAILDATAFTLHGATTRDSVVLAWQNPGVAFDVRAFPGDSLVSGAALAWTSGTALGVPAGVGASDPYGQTVGGGRDVLGDVTTDLVVSDATRKRVLVYDGARLLSGDGPVPGATLDPNGETNGDVGQCAVLLPDIDGDGKAEFSGCSPAASNSAAYLGFGFTGATQPWTSAAVPGVFQPGRGQRVGGNAAVFAQGVGAGRVTSAVMYDLVVLAHSGTSDTIWLLH